MPEELELVEKNDVLLLSEDFLVYIRYFELNVRMSHGKRETKQQPERQIKPSILLQLNFPRSTFWCHALNTEHQPEDNSIR